MIGTCEAVEALEKNLEEGRDHDDAEYEHTNGLEAPPANRVGVLVVMLDELRSGPDNGCRKEVESSVDKRCEHRQGGCKDYYGDFPGEEDSVRGQVDVDGHSYHLATTVRFFVVTGVLELVSSRSVFDIITKKRGVLIWELV